MSSFSCEYREFKTIVFPARQAKQLLDAGTIIDWREQWLIYRLSVWSCKIVGKELIAKCVVLDKEAIH